GLHAQRAGEVEQCAQLVVAEGGDDEEHQVGTVGPGLPDLVLLDEEVLAQHRYVHRGAHRRQVVQGAAEPAALGEHADRARATRGVGGGEGGGVGDVGQPALGGTAPLDLGDHVHALGTGAEVGEDVESGGRREGGLPHGLGGEVPASFGEVL